MPMCAIYGCTPVPTWERCPVCDTLNLPDVVADALLAKGVKR